MENEKRKENIQFRILYLIGILLIVMCHVEGTGGISLLFDWFPAYSFHLGLFVFCSGYFFLRNVSMDTKKFVLKIIKKFLIPLYFWNIIYGIICTILRYYGVQFGAPLSFNSIFILPIYNGHQFTFNLATWFIWPLFIIELLNIFVIKLIKNNTIAYYIYFILTLILGFSGVILAIKGYNYGFYLLLTKILYFLPFFSLGMLYKIDLEKKDILPNVIYFTLIFIITLVQIYLFNGPIKYTPSWCNDFDNYYRPFLVGFIGIAFWLRVSKILVPILNNKLTLLISKNTFAIMIHQFFAFFIVNTFYYICSLIFNLKGFNYSEYISNIFYLYLPKNLTQFSIIYVIAGLFIPIYISIITSKIKVRIIKMFTKR